MEKGGVPLLTIRHMLQFLVEIDGFGGGPCRCTEGGGGGATLYKGGQFLVEIDGVGVCTCRKGGGTPTVKKSSNLRKN